MNPAIVGFSSLYYMNIRMDMILFVDNKEYSLYNKKTLFNHNLHIVIGHVNKR